VTGPAQPGLLAIQRFLPEHRYPQPVVTEWVRRWLAEDASDTRTQRLLSVYAAAGVRSRGSVVPIEEVFAGRDFETQNDRFREIARLAGIDVAGRALAEAGLAPAEIGIVVSVSCTGFMIPAVDAYVAEALGLGPRLVRLPITESGCAGGVVGLARARDHLLANPASAALVLAMEFSSLTFQRWDRSPTNVVSSALFGDGGAALVLVGAAHPAAARARLRLAAAESAFFPGTTHLMGFRLRNQGLQIILDRGLAPFVRREVGPAIDGFLQRQGLHRGEVQRWILHPGGRRVIEVMAEQLGLAPDDLADTARVLAEHGNMSSVTVLFVLDEMLRRHPLAPGERALMAAFGPGFGAEVLLLEA
jgi:alkylresorcinol/alkylpyrone synthase